MPPANGVYKLAVIGTVHTQQHIHTLHFRSTTDPDSLLMTEPQYMQALVTAWQGAPATAYRAIFSTVVNPVQSFQVRKECGSVPLPAGLDFAQPGGSQVGTGSGGAFLGEIAAPWLSNVVTERSAYAGRSYRGRFFLGGMTEAMLAISQVHADRLTATTAYCTALTNAFITPSEVDTPFKLFVFSRVLADGKPASGSDPAIPPAQCQDSGADVLSFQVRDNLATTKSRKVGSGI